MNIAISRKLSAMLLVLLILMCAGCTVGNDVVSNVYSFEQSEVVTVPQIQEYSFEEAVQMGELQKLDGVLPGAGIGTWYIISIGGVEYYYGSYETKSEEYELFSWSIVDNSYELINGIKIGMNEEDILAQYPNMAVLDFDNNFVYEEVTACLGWNGTAYPHSYTGMDVEWNYEGKDYYWTDQFDYIMIADIVQEPDELPVYLGLLMKDNTVTAITFYCPTAG